MKINDDTCTFTFKVARLLDWEREKENENENERETEREKSRKQKAAQSTTDGKSDFICKS